MDPTFKSMFKDAFSSANYWSSEDWGEGWSMAAVKEEGDGEICKGQGRVQ